MNSLKMAEQWITSVVLTAWWGSGWFFFFRIWITSETRTFICFLLELWLEGTSPGETSCRDDSCIRSCNLRKFMSCLVAIKLVSFWLAVRKLDQANRDRKTLENVPKENANGFWSFSISAFLWWFCEDHSIAAAAWRHRTVWIECRTRTI